MTEEDVAFNKFEIQLLPLNSFNFFFNLIFFEFETHLIIGVIQSTSQLCTASIFLQQVKSEDDKY